MVLLWRADLKHSSWRKTFYGDNMKGHQKSIDSLHSTETPKKWDDFAAKAKDPSFVKAVKNDPRSDGKLIMHAERLSELHKGKPVAQVQGNKGTTYKVTKLASGDYGCTCNDWRYKGSVKVGYKCKHIKEYIVRSRNGNKN